MSEIESLRVEVQELRKLTHECMGKIEMLSVRNPKTGDLDAARLAKAMAESMGEIEIRVTNPDIDAMTKRIEALEAVRRRELEFVANIREAINQGL